MTPVTTILSLFFMSHSNMMTLICVEAPDLTEKEVKERAQELFPYNLGQNRHNQIYYYGLSCLENKD